MRKTTNLKIKQKLQLAIKDINESQIEQRLIAIENLKEIADKYPEEYNSIIQILINFIKTKRSLQILNDCENNPITEISADIQTALIIVTNPDIDEYLRKDKIDLSYTDIRGVNLRGGNLKKINLQNSILYRANLIDANLENANLNATVLSAANISHANLGRANLSGAILNAANLCGTNLIHADLRGANLFLANLQGANLYGANFDGANMREADFSSNKATNNAQT